MALLIRNFALLRIFTFTLVLVVAHTTMNGNVDDPVAALVAARTAVSDTEGKGDLRKEHDAMTKLVSAELLCGSREDVLRSSLRALDLSRALGDPRMIALDLRNVSVAFARNGQYAMAEKEARNALAMAVPLKEFDLSAELLHFLVGVLLKNDKLDEAQRVTEEALRLADGSSDERNKALGWADMARVLAAQGKNSDALTILAKSHRSLAKDGTPRDRFNIELEQARVLVAMQHAGKAGSLLDGLDEYVLTLKEPEALREVDALRYEWALQQGRTDLALERLQRIKATDDSLRMAQDGHAMAALRVLHDLERHEKDNAELRASNEQKEVTIAEQRIGNRLLMVLVASLIIAIVALVLSSIFILRIVKRVRLKNAVIRRQHDEIQAKHVELQRQNKRLTETLISEEEKEVLLREIHHRIKNNLQVVDSLLGIQMGQHGDPILERGFREAQGRVRSMAMVHETIYKATTSHQNSLHEHLNKLTRSILVTYGVHDRISVQVDIAPIDLPEDQLLPLTLLVNELLTNSVKYAFEGRESGHVHVVLRPAGERFELIFSDDGIGKETEAVVGRGHGISFGTELISILAKQLNGELRELRGSGTAISMVFGPLPQPLRIAS
jgi:two-component sensor histidine kinase